MNLNLPLPALNRLCTIYRLLGDLQISDVEIVSSSELGRILGEAPHNIRKDINLLGEVGNTGSGYRVSFLKEAIRNHLQLDTARNACVVGLGRIGSAVLAYERFDESGFTIVAGFDSDINLLDTIPTTVSVYPSHEIDEIVKRKNVQLAVIAVPAKATHIVADRLIKAGVRGILNFSPAIVTSDDPGVYITNMDMIYEFTRLSAQMSLDDLKQKRTN